MKLFKYAKHVSHPVFYFRFLSQKLRCRPACVATAVKVGVAMLDATLLNAGASVAFRSVNCNIRRKRPSTYADSTKNTTTNTNMKK